MLYLETENLPIIFELVRKYYARTEEAALYNISIAVADSHKYVNNFEELKKSVEAFFEFALTEVLEA